MEKTEMQSLNLFPGESNGEFGWKDENGIVIEKGRGCHLQDINGKEYLDFSMAWGSAICGHAHPEILGAATQAMQKGTNFSCINRYALNLAERIHSLCPFVESMRFVASGTEATMMCCRVARTYTGKKKVLKFEGAYHGQHPIGIVSMIGESFPDFPQPDISGASDPFAIESILVAPFNDLETSQRIIAEHADDLACVIMEPVHRCLKPVAGFLDGIRNVTRQFAVPLIFDEVVTGFRLAPGGAASYYGVTPDLVAYGKGLGGGFPIGCYGGNKDLMEVVNEARYGRSDYAWSASTSGGNPVSTAAALATLDILSRKESYPFLHNAGEQLRNTLTKCIEPSGLPFQILGDGPLAQVAFSPSPVTDNRSLKMADSQLARSMMNALIDLGIFLNPMGTKLYLSLSHSQQVIEQFSTKLSAAMDSLLT